MTFCLNSFILYSMNLNQIKKPVCIVGLGKSGNSAYQFLLAAGLAPNDVITFDQKDSSAQLKQWSELDLLSVGTLVVSPGVPLKSPEIQALIKKGWVITSEINLATSILNSEKVIGITGSVGKSTVTSLLGTAVLQDDPHAFVGGNLGTPFCDYALKILKGGSRANWIVLELSSYQLENSNNLKLEYSAITYLSPNHLERYGSLDEYYLTKCQIGKMSAKGCVINSESKDLMRYQNKITGQVWPTVIRDVSIALIGKHNQENYLLAEKLANLMGLSASALKAMSEFKGLAHRLETVGRWNDILFINDSKATAMDSVLVAAEAALSQTQKTMHLLLGGKDKNLPWDQLNQLQKNNRIQFYFFGHCGELAKQKSGLHGEVFTNLDLACQAVFKSATAKDVVLLSPGGTSLDQFKNFEERGQYFKDLIVKFYSEK